MSSLPFLFQGQANLILILGKHSLENHEHFNASNFKTKKTKHKKLFQLKLHIRNNQITISSLIFLRNENLKWRKFIDSFKIIVFVIHWSTFIQNLYLRNQKEKWNLDLRLNDCGMQVSILCVCLACASFAFN